ncbi:unnamed protein product, partial [marine sediment metagenome]
KEDTVLSLEELDKLGRIVWSKNKMQNNKKYVELL